MQRLVTVPEMKQLDRLAVEQWGIPGVVLMENAGRAVADAVEEANDGTAGLAVTVICGRGNNGGDGFVIARHLLNRDARVHCLLLGEVETLKGDARANADILINAGIPIHEVSKADQLAAPLADCELVVDAVFGTGLSDPPRGLAADAIRHINNAGRFVVSVDVPSGVNADTGEADDPAVFADITVTMGLFKTGLALFPGREHAGEIDVADIGIPAQLLEQHAAPTFLPEDEDVWTLLPPRPVNGHKGTFGTALLVCGARGFTGAAALAGAAAVRSGCGLVKLAVPAGVCSIVEALVTEAVKIPLPQTEASTIAPPALDEILRHATTARCVAIGPGITTHPETASLLHALLPRLTCPVVIDADGINNLAGRLEILSEMQVPVILTPHPGELAGLTGLGASEINRDRINVCRRFAADFNVVLVLKGAPTVTATPAGETYVNPTGNSGLGSGGTGDVLTGLIAGLLAQGADPANAAVAATYIHGRSADIATEELTEYCLTAGDVIDHLPDAFRSLLEPDSPAAEETPDR